MKKNAKKVQAISIALLLSFSICASNNITVFAASNNSNITQTENSNINSNKISSNVVQIDKDETKEIQSHVEEIKKEGNGQVITLDNSNTTLNNSKSGDIFLMEPTKDNPLGSAAKVVSNTTTSDGKNVVKVTTPKIDELLSELNFNVSKYLDKGSLIASKFPEGTSIKFIPNDNQGEDIQISLPNLNFSYKGMKINNAPSILLKNPMLTANMDFKKAAGIKNIGAKLSTTIECEDNLSLKGSASIKANDIAKLTDISKLLGPSSSNSIGIGNGLTLSGVDMNDKLVLGSLTYTIGSTPIIRPGGSVVDIPLGATLFIYLTLDGKIEAEANIDMKESCYVEKGINLSGQTVDKTIPDNSKTNLTVNGSLNGDLKMGVGAGLGIVVLGIIPADVTMGIEGDINGSASGNIDIIKQTCTGSVNLNGSIKLLSEGNFKAQLQLLKFPPIKLDKTIKFLDKTLYNWNYKASFTGPIGINQTTTSAAVKAA